MQSALLSSSTLQAELLWLWGKCGVPFRWLSFGFRVISKHQTFTSCNNLAWELVFCTDFSNNSLVIVFKQYLWSSVSNCGTNFTHTHPIHSCQNCLRWSVQDINFIWSLNDCYPPLGIHQLLPLYNCFSIHRSGRSPTVKLISEHSLPTSEAYVPLIHNCLLR